MINQGSTSELCPASWNLFHRSPFSSKAWMSLAASLISLRSTCLCWVIPLTLRTLRARSLFTTGASSQSRSCQRVKKQCRSRQRALKRSNGVFKCLSKSETKHFTTKIMRLTIIRCHTYANILQVPANFLDVYGTVKGHPATSVKPVAMQSVLSRYCVVTRTAKITEKT